MSSEPLKCSFKATHEMRERWRVERVCTEEEERWVFFFLESQTAVCGTAQVWASVYRVPRRLKVPRWPLGGRK